MLEDFIMMYGAMIVVVFAVVLVLWLISAFCLYRLLAALGSSVSWMAWIPFGCISQMGFCLTVSDVASCSIPTILLKICGVGSLLTMASAVPVVGFVFAIVGGICSFLYFIFTLVTLVNLCSFLGKSPVLYILLMLFVPGIGTIIDWCLLRGAVMKYAEEGSDV